MPPSRRWPRWLRRTPTEWDDGKGLERESPQAITFPEVTDAPMPPKNDSVLPGVFYRVVNKARPKWALFLCPCGCEAIVTLSLQRIHRPHWAVRRSNNNRPSMSPSVRRITGCLSHFWVHDGRVYWCNDTGSPLAAAPRSPSRKSK
jgi:hypothetical protein